MTPKQKRVYDYITSVLKQSEICPSYAEIMKALNISSKSIVAHYLNMLEKDGKIKINKGRKRGIEIIDENAQLKSKLQLKETEYDFDTARLEEENAQLKELLKECLAHLTIGKYGTSVTPINILCDEVEEVLK